MKSSGSGKHSTQCVSVYKSLLTGLHLYKHPENEGELLEGRSQFEVNISTQKQRQSVVRVIRSLGNDASTIIFLISDNFMLRYNI